MERGGIQTKKGDNIKKKKENDIDRGAREKEGVMGAVNGKR